MIEIMKARVSAKFIAAPAKLCSVDVIGGQG